MGSTEWVEKHQDELKHKGRCVFQLRLDRARLAAGVRLARARAIHHGSCRERPTAGHHKSEADYLHHPPVDDLEQPKPAQGNTELLSWELWAQDQIM